MGKTQFAIVYILFEIPDPQKNKNRNQDITEQHAKVGRVVSQPIEHQKSKNTEQPSNQAKAIS